MSVRLVGLRTYPARVGQVVARAGPDDAVAMLVERSLHQLFELVIVFDVLEVPLHHVVGQGALLHDGVDVHSVPQLQVYLLHGQHHLC